jgi:L-aminopeptidase/D-esterase-like protein
MHVLGGSLTDVPGIAVGHYTDLDSATGCTAIIARAGAVGGVEVRGAYPGTCDTCMLGATRTPVQIHAILLAGGSNYGLETASGAMAYLEQNGLGHRLGKYIVPRVSAAVIFDLSIGKSSKRPGNAEGYAACEAASTASIAQGCVGAGTGATVGKLLGKSRAMKGGFGMASLDLGGGLWMGAAVVTNAFGGIYHPNTGALLAGPLSEDRRTIVDTVETLLCQRYSRDDLFQGMNTTIGIIATNAKLNSVQANQLASSAHDGLALAVRPAHTEFDGDTIFCLSTGTCDAQVQMAKLGIAATALFSRAIVNSVHSAVGLCGVPAISDLNPI